MILILNVFQSNMHLSCMVTVWLRFSECFTENLIHVLWCNQWNYWGFSICLILLALCNMHNPFRHPHPKSHWLCRHYWHNHWPALDPSELYYHRGVPGSGSNFRRELANFSRYGGSICWLLHDSWFGARRGLWHQYLHCYRRGGQRAGHTNNANACWWFNLSLNQWGRGWVLIWGIIIILSNSLHHAAVNIWLFSDIFFVPL